MALKPVTFHGDSLDQLRTFPEDARRQAGHELWQVQKGEDPVSWKPIRSIGVGVREIRVREPSGAYRIIYIATLPDAVHVLHAFQKKSDRIAQRDMQNCVDTLPPPSARAAMKTKTFANVWDALEASPEDAATMTRRSEAMLVIAQTVRGWRVAPARAAKRLGISQTRLNDLLRGKINKFSLNTLLTLATRAGLKVKVDIEAAA